MANGDRIVVRAHPGGGRSRRSILTAHRGETKLAHDLVRLDAAAERGRFVRQVVRAAFPAGGADDAVVRDLERQLLDLADGTAAQPSGGA